jgi:hypothetical protein
VEEFPELFHITYMPAKCPVGRIEWNGKQDGGFTNWLKWDMSKSMGMLLEEVNVWKRL